MFGVRVVAIHWLLALVVLAGVQSSTVEHAFYPSGVTRAITRARLAIRHERHWTP